MEEDKPAEENPTFPPTEPDQDTNVSLDMEGTSESSLGQEDSNRPDIIGSSSSEQELQSLPSSSKTDSETGENFRSIWCLPRVDHTTTSLSSDESSETTESLKAEKETPVSKGAFKIPPEVISGARPSISVTEEKVEGADEIAVKNPKEQMVTIEAPARAELDYWKFSKNLSSRTVSTTSEDTLPDHGVYVSEDQIAANMKENISNVSKSERNLRKYLKYTESREKALPLDDDGECRNHEVTCKKLNSDGAISDIYYCRNINKIASTFTKMKIGNVSNSAPPSFVDENCSDEIVNIEHKTISDDTSSLKGYTQTLTHEACSSHVLKTETSIPLSQDLFKVPDVPKVAGKNFKTQTSSNLELPTHAISKLASDRTQFPSNSPRRPADFNISPRQSVHMFDPGNSSGILRQCHSLPNINHAPKKDLRRSSINVDSRKLSCSVKALFSGDSNKVQPTTPESSISIVDIKDISKNFLFKSLTNNSSDPSKLCSKEQQILESKCVSENSISNISNLNKSKTCKKLIFVSPCENTNEIQTLQESSTSSLEVSQNISSMKLTESVDSGLKLPLVESPPPSKRKMSDPDLSVEDCSGNPSKKVRILPEEVSSESNQMTDEELQEKGAASACSETADTETDKGPLIEFPEEAVGCSKSERGSTKRTVMAEDVTEVSSDVKRIKPSD